MATCTDRRRYSHSGWADCGSAECALSASSSRSAVGAAHERTCARQPLLHGWRTDHLNCARNEPAVGRYLTNAKTAKAILRSPSPDITELNEIVDDILHDDRRASEIIRQTRSLLKKAPFDPQQFDLNEVVRETVDLLSAVAVGRKVALSNFLAPGPTSNHLRPYPTSASHYQLGRQCDGRD